MVERLVRGDEIDHEGAGHEDFPTLSVPRAAETGIVRARLHLKV